MSKPLLADTLKRSFIMSLSVITVVIGASEALIMLLLDMIRHWDIALTPKQEAWLDAVLLTGFSTPLLWLLALRPLAKRIENEQLRTAEQTRLNSELRLALDAHAMVSITDRQGYIIYANEKFCKISGYLQSELLGLDYRILNSGFHNKDYIRNLWGCIEQGFNWHGEFRNRRKDGSLYWVDTTIAPLHDEDGKSQQYICIQRDITTKKADEEKLTKLKHALDASNEMILITDPNGRIQYANPALCYFTNWSEDALAGQSSELLVSPNASQEALADLRQKLDAGESWSGRLLNWRHGVSPVHIEERSISADELEYWVHVNVTPVLNSDDVISGYVQIQHDVSSVVEREEALRREAADTE